MYPKFKIYFLYKLQLQSSFVCFIFVLKIFGAEESLNSSGSFCHTFWPMNLMFSVPNFDVLAGGKLIRLLLRRLYGSFAIHRSRLIGTFIFPAFIVN